MQLRLNERKFGILVQMSLKFVHESLIEKLIN